MTRWARKPRRTGFSSGQQPELRLYLTLAWAKNCEDEGLNPADRCRGTRCGECVYCTWYEDILKRATGKKTSTACNAGRDYDFLMRDLEIIHGKVNRWQLRACKGDAVRIIYELRKAVEDHQIEEHYIRSVAKNMLQLDRLPALESLAPEQLIIILGEVKRFIRRKLKRERFATPTGTVAPGTILTGRVLSAPKQLDFTADGDPVWDV